MKSDMIFGVRFAVNGPRISAEACAGFGRAGCGVSGSL